MTKLTWVDRLTRRAVAFDQRDQRAWIENPRRMRWLMWRMLLGVAIGLATLGYLSWRTEIASVWDTLLWAVFGGFVGRGFMGGMRRALAYRNGWMDGRIAMVASLKEALTQRGMSIEEWLQGEWDRDMAILLGAIEPGGDRREP
jgi:hypothetical protein